VSAYIGLVARKRIAVALLVVGLAARGARATGACPDGAVTIALPESSAIGVASVSADSPCTAFEDGRGSVVVSFPRSAGEGRCTTGVGLADGRRYQAVIRFAPLALRSCAVVKGSPAFLPAP
jgi:hypothetical protein